jgi:hypothetical protein
LHKLRRAMVRPERDLHSGVVELDEVFIGNESRGRAGGVKDNCAAMIAVESIPNRKLGRVRIEVAETARMLSVVEPADNGFVEDADRYRRCRRQGDGLVGKVTGRSALAAQVSSAW